jgi:tetratricopeptide (TPR) repeat protein
VSRALTAYRVFIASPGGLAAERQAFRDIIHSYNEMDAIPRGLLFIPVGWEATLPGMGRPQSLINEDLRDCDYFVLVLWDRWGSSSGSEKYTSATTEEYSVAQQCREDPHHCLREIAAFFKAVDARQMSDPGEQLRNVLDFRRHLEQGKELLFGTFDDVASFQRQIQRLLAKWVRDHEQKRPGAEKNYPVQPVAPMPEFTRPDLRPSLSVTAGLNELDGSAAIIDEAQRLAAQGKLTDAETLFARALVKGDPEIAIQYARFLRRLGRFSQAQGLLEGVLQRPNPGEEHWKAGAYNYLGMLHRDRGELSDAEHMFKKALESSDHPGSRLTTIAAYNNLGQLLRDRGSLDEAAQMHQRALELCDPARDEASLASSYGNLAHIFLIRGNWDQCEEANQKAVQLSEKIGNAEGAAIALRNQGLLLVGRQRLDAAEQVLQRSLSLATKIGRQKSMADASISLARIRFERGDLREAEDLLAKAIETNERIGRLKGLARGLGQLGEVQQKKGDDVQAERSLLRCIEIARGLGDQICLANAYAALGSIFEGRGDKPAAFLLWRNARQLFEAVGVRSKVQDLSNKLARAAAP